MTPEAPGPGLLRIGHTALDVVDTLGPGRRSVVWVQGCTIHCAGCIVPESWRAGGRLVDPAELADELLADQDAQLTVSGGEPTEQPAAVARLLAAARERGRTTWVYTGRSIEDLVAEGDDDLLTMLALTDVLVDGPFAEDQAGGVGYRGSRNQRILRLTDAVDEESALGGRPGKIELRLSSSNHELTLIGIPEPGLMTSLRERLAARGHELNSRHWR
ncbi:4Fe-4S single cluster domain-containing protein [Nocardioides sp. W7]|uniref:4Fe-4S single cluster domain-containing protein n=1 Tax=Nocardioides sp. W7 TaxID=2931390 RepID=UPI001FD1F740|nr:4Fe-4S single cluster domain-containing protein [Nocardioides sp. W7]